MYNNKLVVSGDLYSADAVICNNIAMYNFDSVNTVLNGIHNNIAPVKFSLYQNYPNPFNPETNIKFELDKESFISMKIYDIIGREVETLVNQNYTRGTHIINWNASRFASGVYFYRMEAGDNVSVKKMVLIK
jgi:hypothetical protein